jgi:hypothetical protein
MTTADVGRHLCGSSDAGVGRRDPEAMAFDAGPSAVHLGTQQRSAADPRVAGRRRDQLTVELPEHDPYITVEAGRALLKLILKIRSATRE